MGGNVLTSQRVTDVILRAFEACAASQGCCNNLTFGFGGRPASDAGTSSETRGFGYYETIAGGSGAGSSWHGASGVHTHMTNTRITDAEIFERRYPVVLREFALRQGSGGVGQYRGGEGVIRDVEFRRDLTVSILSERRVYRPYGLQGGGDGEGGMNLWVRRTFVAGQGTEHDDAGATGQYRERQVNLGGKNTAQMKAGDRIIIKTPGGGGWGLEGADAATSDGLSKKDPRFGWRGGSHASREEMALQA